MGVRGEIFSTKVSLPNRTYFFNIKENRMGDLYLNIVESKNKETGGFDRQSVIVFAEDLQQYLIGFEEALKSLEKAVRAQRKTKRDKGESTGGTRTGSKKNSDSPSAKAPRERKVVVRKKFSP